MLNMSFAVVHKIFSVGLKAVLEIVFVPVVQNVSYSLLQYVTSWALCIVGRFKPIR